MLFWGDPKMKAPAIEIPRETEFGMVSAMFYVEYAWSTEVQLQLCGM